MFKNPNMFSRGKFGMSCTEDYDKWRIWKIKHDLRKRTVLEPNNTDWDVSYSLHRVRIDGGSYLIDDEEPMIPSVHCLSNNKYHRRLANQVRYERENAVLIKKIQQIFLGQGGVENRLHPLTRCINNRGKFRRNKLLEIAIHNCAKVQYINSAKAIISRDVHLKWYDEQRKYRDRMSKYPYFRNSRMCAPFELIAQRRALEEPRPLCWIDIEVDQVIVGRVYFVLYADICPMTSENFRSLCAGDRGKTFQCSNMECMVPNKIWIFGGASRSIYGELFPAENFNVKHDRAGILSMFCYGDRTISSQFLITGEASPSLDGKHVAFGRVIKGMSFLRKIGDATTVSAWGKPRKRVMITFCGQTNLKFLKRLPEPRMLEDLHDHIEANKQWQLRNPFTKLDKKFKIRKVKDWNQTESSDTFDEEEKKEDGGEKRDDTGYEGGEENSAAESPDATSSHWSSQWSYKEDKNDNKNTIKDDATVEDTKHTSQHDTVDRKKSHHYATGRKKSHQNTAGHKKSHHDATGHQHDTVDRKKSHHDATGHQHDTVDRKKSHHDGTGHQHDNVDRKKSHHDGTGHRHDTVDRKKSPHDATGHQHDTVDRQKSPHDATGHQHDTVVRKKSHHDATGRKKSHHDATGRKKSHHDATGRKKSHHDATGHQHNTADRKKSHHDATGRKKSHHDATGHQHDTVVHKKSHHDATGHQHDTVVHKKSHHDATGRKKSHHDATGRKKSHHDATGRKKSHHDANGLKKSHQNTTGHKKSHQNATDHKKSHHDATGHNKVHDDTDSHQDAQHHTTRSKSDHHVATAHHDTSSYRGSTAHKNTLDKNIIATHKSHTDPAIPADHKHTRNDTKPK